MYRQIEAIVYTIRNKKCRYKCYPSGVKELYNLIGMIKEGVIWLMSFKLTT